MVREKQYSRYILIHFQILTHAMRWKFSLEHKAHDHEHSHKKEEEDMPAWKKKAMEMGDDPMAAPFGGSWNTESKTSASAESEKMQE